MGTLNLIKDRFYHWWKRNCEADFCYEDDNSTNLARAAAERAYIAGWNASKRDRR